MVQEPDPSELHDPLDQNLEENDQVDEAMEVVTDSQEVTPAEESAVRQDNETAEAANEEAEPEKKHKNRESTSEKAKKAAETRIARGETVSTSGAPLKVLDPLRLRGKNYRVKVALLEKGKIYPAVEAIELIKQTNIAKFDAAVEMHLKLRDDNVRGTISLPHGNGKTKKVAVATDEVIEQIAAGKLDFDVLLCTPAQMPKLAKHAKQLGPKGLMPSPKSGTVTEDIDKVKAEIENGRLEYRADKNKIVHLSIGKISFDSEKLLENLEVMQQILLSHKILSISLASTMGPGVKVELPK